MPLAIVFVAGFLVGLRSLTPAAVAAWAVHLGWLRPGPQLTWMGTMAAVGVFTVLALVELAADKHPKTPSRTAPPGMISRIFMGALVGACVATASGLGLELGGVVGIAGSLVGTFAGFKARTGPGGGSFQAALIEDAIAIGGSILLFSRI